MRPAVDGDGVDVALRVETSRRQSLVELIANVMLEDVERRAQEPPSCLPPLLRSLNVRRVVHVAHVEDHRVVRSPGVLVVAQETG